MVPASFPRPDLIVTITGLLEILGKTATWLPLRAFLQIVFIAALIAAGFPNFMNGMMVWLAPR